LPAGRPAAEGAGAAGAASATGEGAAELATGAGAAFSLAGEHAASPATVAIPKIKRMIVSFNLSRESRLAI
jgi:hypothetical protein